MPKTIVVPDTEGWDNVNEHFVTIRGGKLKIEHSLLSISKWEEITEKCFLDSPGLTADEFKLYIKCMTLTPVDPSIYDILTPQNLKDIRKYMERKMSATNFNERPGSAPSRGGEQATSEMIYYQMFTLGIDYECRKWHINKLMTLIKLMSRMNDKAYDPKKSNRRMTAADIKARDQLNEARKKALNTHG